MKFGRKLISVLLMLSLLLSCLPFASAAEAAKEGANWSSYFKENLEPGDFVYYGSFEGTELIWYVCDTDGDEALLYCVTPFLKGEYDASINFYQYTGPGWQVRYGSSSWRTSDVRAFLNSGAEEMEYTDVCFDYSGLSGGTGGSYDASTQNAPPSYANYGGFLNQDNFLEEEVALLNPTVQNTLVSFIDPAHVGSGTPDLREYGYYGAENAHTLVDAGYSHVITEDYMFLFSSEQYHKYETELQWTDYRMDEHWNSGAYWLRDAPKYYTSAWLTYLWVGMYQNFAGASSSYYYGNNDAMESSAYKYADDSIYIRPGCYIATNYVESLSGQGTYEDPYRMTIDPMVLDREEYTEGDIYRQHPTHLNLTVYQNQSAAQVIDPRYVLSEGATVEVAGQKFKTDENGQVTIPYPRSGATISLDGYVTRSVRGSFLEDSPEVYLEQESDFPAVCAVWIDSVDVLHKEYKVDLMNSGTQLVRAEVYWGESSCKTLVLRQGAKEVDLSDGVARVTWSDCFDVSETIDVIAIDEEGDTVRLPLKLKVDTFLPEQLEGYQFSFGGGFGFTLGEEAGPILAGTEVKLGIWSPFQIKCSIENGKVYVLMGIQSDWDNSSGSMKPKQLVLGIKNIMNKVKTGVVDAAKGYRELQDFMNKNNLPVGKGKGSFVVSAGFDVMGFAEGYLNSKGEIIFIDGGYILSGHGGFSYGVPFAVGTIPLFFEIDLDSTLSFQGNVSVNPDAKAFTPEKELEWKTVVNGGLGVGIKDALSISGGLEGTMTTTWEIHDDTTDYIVGRQTLRTYIKGNVAIFEVKPEFPPIYDEIIFEYPETGNTKNTQNPTATPDFYDSSAYTLQTPTQSTWHRSTKNGNAVLLSGLSDSADPQLLRLSNGKLALLYVAQNPEFTDANGQQLYVTTYDGSSWSEPTLFYDNGTVDAFASVNDGYVTWTEIDTLSAGSTLADASTRIMAGKLSSDGTYSGLPLSVSGFGTLAYQPVIVDTSGTTPMSGSQTVIWQGNANGDWFSPEGNVIYTATSGFAGMWNSPTAAYTDLGMITDLTADDHNSKVRIAWAMDTDGDIYTSEDVEIFVDGVQLTDNEVAESNLCYYNGVLYWYADGKIYADGQVILESGEVALSPVFQLVEDKAILFTAENGLYTTLYASWNQDGVWSAPVALTDGTEHIYDFSAALDKNGKLQIALCTKSVDPENTENPYGEGCLQVRSVENGVDLQLLYADTDASCYVSGKDQVFDLAVTNSGNETAAGIKVELIDNTTGYTVEHLEQAPVAPGQRLSFSCAMPIPSATKPREITIRLTPLEAEELNPEDNETVQSLNWNDLAVESLSWGYRADGNAVIYGSIVNRSYNARENITLSLRKGSAEGEVVETMTIEKLEALGLQGVSFAVAPELDTVYFITLETRDDNSANDVAFTAVNAALGETPDDSDDPDDPVEDNTPCDGGSSCPGRSFTDMPPAGVWSHAGIDYVISHGLMNGMSTTSFQPEGSMTRAMLVTVLWRYAGQPVEGSNSFTDVPSNVWYTQAVAWAAEKGIVTGIGGGRFNPDGQITREQLAVILYRYCKSIGIDTSDAADITTFPDANQVSGYAIEALSWAVRTGLVTGSAAGGKVYLEPQGNATRAQVATILMRFIQNVVE